MKYYLIFLLLCPWVLFAQTGPGGVSSNLTLWFKGNTGTATTGSNLTSWADQSGNGFDISQGVVANQPQLQASDINFNPALVFDGGNDYLPISSKNYTGTTALSALTCFVIYKTDYSGTSYNSNWSFLDFDRSDFFNTYIHGGNGNLSISYRSGGTTYDNDALTTGLNDGNPHLGVFGYNNAVVNETTIRVDGVQDLAVDRVPNGATLGLSSTRYGFIGDGSEANTEDGTRNNIYFDGSIAEVILFESALNATQINQVESYLAIKYGLTLGNNASPVSYVASDGSTTIWSGSATYQNGVAGIGRDDNSFLIQTKSSSSIESAVAIEAETSFSSDLTFMVWGHDNAGSGLTGTNLPPGFTQRLQKTWTVQNTGSPGTITVDYIITNTGFNSYQAEDYTLLVDDNGDFTDGGHIEFTANSMVGDTVRFTGISMSTGDFFTLAGPNFKSPGGLSSGLALWYRGDAGVTSSGGFVSDWKDNSAQQNHAAQSIVSNQPELLSSDFNYNPGLSFDDINDYLPITNINFSGAASLNQVLTMVVYKTDVSGGTNDNWAFLDFDRSEYFNFSIKGNGGLRFSYSSSSTIYDLDGATNGLNDNLPRLGTAVYDNTLTNETEIRTGGRRDYLNNNLATSATLGTSLTRFGHIGDGSESDTFDGGRNGNYYGGEIAELIFYENQSFTATQILILESYLSIKYALSLSKNTNNNGVSLESPNSEGINEGDYLNSSGISIWDASANDGYDNDVIAIGRDDNTGLLQKQSHNFDDSLRIYLNTLQLNNGLNTAAKSDFGADQSFLFIGHNGDQQYDSGATYGEWPSGIFARIDREWKIQNTNFTGTFSLDFTLNANSDISTIDPADIVLMVDDDGDFTNATFFDTGDGLTISSVGNTLTIGGITTGQIPSNTSRFISVGISSPGVSLPIELISFDGEVHGNSVKLIWKVASEINNDFFTVERSKNADDWEIVGTIAGAGNSHIETTYQLIDENPYRNLSYYRLKQTDFDGQYEYFRPITLTNTKEIVSPIYPNPADDYLILRSNDELPVNIRMYDIAGNLLFKETIHSQGEKLDTSKLKNGIYILEISHEKHRVVIRH